MLIRVLATEVRGFFRRKREELSQRELRWENFGAQTVVSVEPAGRGDPGPDNETKAKLDAIF
jgi:hypothetical protein